MKPDDDYITKVKEIQDSLLGILSMTNKIIDFAGAESEFESLSSKFIFEISAVNYGAQVYTESLRLKGVCLDIFPHIPEWNY